MSADQQYLKDLHTALIERIEFLQEQLLLLEEDLEELEELEAPAPPGREYATFVSILEEFILAVTYDEDRFWINEVRARLIAHMDGVPSGTN